MTPVTYIAVSELHDRIGLDVLITQVVKQHRAISAATALDLEVLHSELTILECLVTYDCRVPIDHMHLARLDLLDDGCNLRHEPSHLVTTEDRTRCVKPDHQFRHSCADH